MPFDVGTRMAARAAQYLRTAEAALKAGDLDAAFENARTAAELAAKAMLIRAQVPFGADHNVAGALVRAGCWPKGRGAELSKFLGEYVRGVYSFTAAVVARDATHALRLARELCDRAAKAPAAG